LAPTSDILLSTRDARKPGSIAVGFALETEDLVANARGKLGRKGLDMIVLNSARDAGAGFEFDTNRVTLIHKDGAVTELPLLTKSEVADEILDRVEELLGGP
jgi:phosphopantothenoylcysteine decarboxylase / phosphopantothenate---cysteine ligase